MKRFSNQRDAVLYGTLNILVSTLPKAQAGALFHVVICSAGHLTFKWGGGIHYVLIRTNMHLLEGGEILHFPHSCAC